MTGSTVATRPDTSRVCKSCSSKLTHNSQSIPEHMRFDRTTVMRPVVSANLTGKEIPRLDSSESGSTKKKDSWLVVETSSSGSGRTLDPEKALNTESAAIGRRFGSYEILSEISRGSFGVVYRAKQQGLDRIVALKVLLAGVHASSEAVNRFQREAKAVARLKHPNIVPIYDIGTHDGHHYFAMEFIEGKPLSSLVSDGKLTISRALELAEALADALEHAHQGGVIHRDIKPSNIIVDEKGQPHITDFGLAKQVDLDTKYTLSGTTLGTPAYMPPEQARGEIEKIDARADVYAVGAVLFEMLTGQTPFAGRSLLEVVVAVINEPVKPPRQLNPRIHRDVQTIVMKCLEKDKRLRYDSAKELAEDLRRFRSGEDIKAKPAGIIRIGARFAQRNAPWIAAACVVVVGLAYSLRKTGEINEKDKVIEQLKQEVEIVKETKEAQWRPDWWFPPKSPAELHNAELRNHYKVPEGQEALFRGFSKGKDGFDLRGEKTEKIGHIESLVSPDDKRFFGDVEAQIVFTLGPEIEEQPAKDKKPKPGEKPVDHKLRIGLQTVQRGYEGIPYLAEFGNGYARVIGPADLYNYAQPAENERKGQLRLEAKAEKTAPPLVTGRYDFTLRREGTKLEFVLSGPPQYGTVSFTIKDGNLSNWLFKNTQIVFRNPPPGLAVSQAEVRRKYGGDEEPAFSYFRLGEYNVAESELKVISTGEDRFKRAKALYQLGWIQEICEPGAARERRIYTDALSELEQMPSDEARAKERQALIAELRFRRMVRFARDRQWNAMVDELNQGWRDGKIGEPFAWELPPFMEMALKDPEKTESVYALLELFKRLGLEPGSTRFGKLAAELGMILVHERRYEDVANLQKYYPSPMLNDVFFAAIKQAREGTQLEVALNLLSAVAPNCKADKDQKQLSVVAGELAGAFLRSHRYTDAATLFGQVPSEPLLKALGREIELNVADLSGNEFYEFIAKLLPIALNNCATDTMYQQTLNTPLEKLCIEIVASGRVTKLIRLHEVLRGPRQVYDSRLAASFADAIRRLAQVGDAASEALALQLLKYCADHVDRANGALQNAACALAKQKAVVDDARTYAAILTIQRAFPAAGLQLIARDVMLELKAKSRFEEGILFFSQARVEFGEEARELLPVAMAILENIRSEDQRAQLLAAIWQTVAGELETRQGAAALPTWKLEYGDMLLVLNRWDRARDIYQGLTFDREMPVDLRARASLRLSAVSFSKSGSLRSGDVLLPLLNEDDVREEYRLAAMLLAMPEQLRPEGLKEQLTAIGAPLLLTEAEWDLVRGIRLKMENNPAALPALEAAAKKSSSSRAWVSAVASQLVRGGTRSPDEETQPPQR